MPQLMRRSETEAWNPLREMEALSNRINRLFGLTRWTGNGEREMLATTDWSPSCDISETDDQYRIRAELPDVQRDDVHVTLEGGVLCIEGRRKETKEEEGVRYHRRELFYGNFMRRFTMPDDADDSSIDASFKDGMLTITINKSKSKVSKAKEIAVH